MKSNSKTFILFVLLTLVFCLSAFTAQAEDCTCLDPDGKAYTKDSPLDSVCFTCSEDACTLNGKTLKECPIKAQPTKAKPTAVPPTAVPPTPVPPTAVPPTPVPPTAVPTEVPVQQEQKREEAPVVNNAPAAPVEKAPVNEIPAAAEAVQESEANFFASIANPAEEPVVSNDPIEPDASLSKPETETADDQQEPIEEALPQAETLEEPETPEEETVPTEDSEGSAESLEDNANDTESEAENTDPAEEESLENETDPTGENKDSDNGEVPTNEADPSNEAGPDEEETSDEAIAATEETPDESATQVPLGSSVKAPQPKPTKTPAPKNGSNKVEKPKTPPIPKPAAPVLECPKGFYTSRSLGFYFAPSKNASEYVIHWSNDKGDKGNATIKNSDSTCKNKRCIKQVTLPKDGKYTWYVTAKNASGKTNSKTMSFEVAQNVSAPKTYQPNSIVYNRNCLSFQWEDVGPAAENYRIQIVGKWDGKVRLDTSFNVSDLYVGEGVCWVSTSLFPPAGTYSWRVKARNSKAESDWSGWKDFTVQCDYCTVGGAYYGNYANTIPSPIYPISTISTTSPEFQWRTLTGASTYSVKVFDANGTLLIDESPDNSVCTLEACTFDPKIELPGNGNYTWTIDGYGPNGGRWGSSNGTFEVVGINPIPEMSFLLPENGGFLSESAPIIFWQDPGKTVSNFQLEVLDKDATTLLMTNLTREDAWCDDTTCSIEFETIPDGSDYIIRITPLTDFMTPGKTISLTFSKGVPPMVLTAPLNNAVVQSRPLFRWNLDAGNTAEYELTLTNAAGENTLYSPLRCDENGLTCEGSDALFVPADTLPAGTYSAAISVIGSQTPSETTVFEVR